MKTSKKQQMFDSLLVQAIFDLDDYNDGKINIDTLGRLYKNVYYIILIHFTESKYVKEFDSNSSIKCINNILNSESA